MYTPSNSYAVQYFLSAICVHDPLMRLKFAIGILLFKEDGLFGGSSLE